MSRKLKSELTFFLELTLVDIRQLPVLCVYFLTSGFAGFAVKHGKS